MIFIKSATHSWHFIFRQKTIAARIILNKPLLRCSSNVPQKHVGTKEELTAPKNKWDPVAQKFLKRLPVEYHGTPPANFNDTTIWYPIYKFPYLHSVRAFVRLKVWVTFLSIATCMYNIVTYILTTSSPVGSATLCACLTIFTMSLAGNLIRKLVVQIYTSEDLEHVRLTRFTFYGRRQDIIMPRSLLRPLADSNDTHRKLALNLETKFPVKVDLDYDNYEFYDEKFNIILLFGGIHNDEKFEAIFGKLLRRVY